MNAHIVTQTRRAFTLVELLVVMGIIGILASMLLMALQSAQETAREAKTRATIAKLDALIRSRWESYRTRRVPLVFPPNTTMTPAAMATARLHALRELMRMEMPDRWTDVVDNPTSGITRPALSMTYLRSYIGDQKRLPPQPPATKENEHAECLYLIVTKGMADDIGGRELFHSSQIGDTDKDERPEFLDGWGRPIRFLRWAPGFPSELHGEIMTVQGGSSPQMVSAGTAALSDNDAYAGRIAIFVKGSAEGYSKRIKSNTYGNGAASFNFDPSLSVSPSKDDVVVIGRPDPFDFNRTNPDGFALYPLIYSAGADGVPDVRGDIDSNPLHYAAHQNNPFANPATGRYIGAYGDTDNDSTTNGALDNIHNHMIGQQ